MLNKACLLACSVFGMLLNGSRAQAAPAVPAVPVVASARTALLPVNFPRRRRLRWVANCRPPACNVAKTGAAPADHTEAVVPLDLTAHYRLKLDKFNNRQYPWGDVPRDAQVFGNIPIEIGGRMTTYGQGNADMGMMMPEQVTGIKVAKKFNTLYLFYTAYFSSKEGAPIADLVFNYDDGSSASFTLRYGVHVRQWYQFDSDPLEEVTDPNSKLVWRARSSLSTEDSPFRLRFYITSIPNPKPTVEVKTIDLVSAKGRSALCVLSMSLGPAGKLKVDKFTNSKPRVPPPTSQP